MEKLALQGASDFQTATPAAQVVQIALHFYAVAGR